MLRNGKSGEYSIDVINLVYNDSFQRIRSLSLSEETPSLFHREDPRQVAFILNPVSGS